MHRKLFIGLATVAIACAAQAQFTPWAQPSGTATLNGTDFFDWSNGESDGFGTPILSGSGNSIRFLFSPNLLAESNGDETVTATGGVRVDLTARPGFHFGGIGVLALGEYSMTGDGGSVDASGNLVVDDTTAFNQDFSEPLTFDTAFPVAGPGNDTFQGSAIIDTQTAFPELTEIHLEFTNGLVAISTGSGQSLIRTSLSSLGVTFDVIPEPASIALLGLLSLGVIRRR